MEMAIIVGKTIIVDNVTENITLSLLSIMKKRISSHGGEKLILFNRKMHPVNSSFALYVVCNKPNPAFDINITNYVTMVNFGITFESLNSQLLDLIVRNERNDLQTRYTETLK